jgi:hypothetical protein
VVFDMTLKTPEYPAGRPLVLIASDITIQSGSLGPKEARDHLLLFFWLSCLIFAQQPIICLSV